MFCEEALGEPRQEFVLMRMARATLSSRLQDRIAGVMRRIGLGTHIRSPTSEISVGTNVHQLRWLLPRSVALARLFPDQKVAIKPFALVRVSGCRERGF